VERRHQVLYVLYDDGVTNTTHHRDTPLRDPVADTDSADVDDIFQHVHTRHSSVTYVV
jgi:hypothetical protein